MQTNTTQVQPKKLLAQVRDKIRFKRYSLSDENIYLSWIKQFILYHGKRHPAEVVTFLTYLATQRHVSPSTQKQILSAILFLYREVPAITLPWLDSFERSKKPRRLPVVLTASEVQTLLREATTAPTPINLIIKLLYGTGMRLMEAVRLRVKDVELARFVCNSFTAKWLRYSHGAGVVRAFGCQYDHDLHSCVEQGWQRGVESIGSALTGAYRVSLRPSNVI